MDALGSDERGVGAALVAQVAQSRAVVDWRCDVDAKAGVRVAAGVNLVHASLQAHAGSWLARTGNGLCLINWQVRLGSQRPLQTQVFSALAAVCVSLSNSAAWERCSRTSNPTFDTGHPSFLPACHSLASRSFPQPQPSLRNDLLRRERLQFDSSVVLDACVEQWTLHRYVMHIHAPRREFVSSCATIFNVQVCVSTSY